MGVFSVSDDTFDKDVHQSDLPVLVDFWAPWCGPCQMFAPVLDDIVSDVSQKLRVAKINIDENPLVPGKLGVRSIPTLMIFHKGSVIETHVGSLSKPKLIQWIDDTLAKIA
jgi:thioredoxin 1